MLLMTTIDDLPLEGIPYITEKILETGAKNVHIINSFTKKGRLEYIILVDFQEEFLEDISNLLALEFGTLGMKIFEYEHKKFPYKIKNKNIIVKIKELDLKTEVSIKYLYNSEKNIISLKAEYEDIKKIAKKLNRLDIEISFSKIKTLIEAEAYKEFLNKDEVEICFK